MDSTNNVNKKATFMLQILKVENSTWQGTVKWLEGGEEQQFRSAIELIRLIDSATQQ